MPASVLSQYMQIAMDIATRIADGELPEGSPIYGRSVLASKYNVSAETIRRSLHLLEDMKVVAIKPQGGAKGLSRDNARRYIDSASETTDLRIMRDQLKSLVEQSVILHEQILDTVSTMLHHNEHYCAARDPLPNYEVLVPEGSAVIGKNLGSLRFWQNTGATVVAIRRDQKLITSPGPYAELYGGDVIMIVGSTAAVEKTRGFVNEGAMI